ncbi:siderophore-interacting protein [Amycolatopsis anabasis]|uniref:siderophore-interacting protein n=1 Tax=Amycolatopsis anabasis TaxID=1840409 RepID=UPI00131C2B70|nr:siderophore-interacting protein [Amycolatopsis anabasis]
MTATSETRQTLGYNLVQVARVRELTPHMVRITLAGEQVREFVNGGPDAYIKVFFPLSGQERPVLPPHEEDRLSWYRRYLAMPDDVRPPMRTYTVRAHRPEQAELDVDFVVHGDTGPATRWAQAAKPGDEVAFIGPGGLYAVPEGTEWQLLVGDETAVPAIAGILEGLPDGQPAQVWIELDDPADKQQFETRGRAEVHWIVRGSRGYGEAVLDAVRAAEFPDGQPYAWLAGEAGLVKFARRHLVRERGIDKRAITFTGYWRQGVSEEQESRESMRKIEAGEPLVDED